MVLESSSTTLTDIDPGTARAGWPEAIEREGEILTDCLLVFFWDKNCFSSVWTIGAWGTDEPRTDSFKTSQLIDKGRPISRSQFITRPRVIAGHGASVVMPDSGATAPHTSPRTQCTSPRVGRPTNVANFMSSTILNYDWRWQSTTVWWFGTFFMFPCIGNNHPNWLMTNIFQRGSNHQPDNLPCLRVSSKQRSFQLERDLFSSVPTRPDEPDAGHGRSWRMFPGILRIRWGWKRSSTESWSYCFFHMRKILEDIGRSRAFAHWFLTLGQNPRNAVWELPQCRSIHWALAQLFLSACSWLM